jgi:pilus assembly protein FimV
MESPEAAEATEATEVAEVAAGGSAVEEVAEIHELSEAEQEVKTKLDLAQVYLEMGDNENAREILQEVMQEGNAQQQEQAHAFLQQAG